MEKLLKFLIFGSMFFVVLSCQDEDVTPQPPAPTVLAAASNAGLSTLVSAIAAVPGLGSVLINADEITVFAPTNDAFAAALTAFGASDLNDLVNKLGGVDNLETVLGFHVVPAVAFAADLQASNTFTTVSGQKITVAKSGNNVTVTDFAGNVANVVTADVAIENGVVHVINKVLIPDIDLPKPTLVEAATSAGLTTLLTAVTAVDGLANALLSAEGITVFAPTNAAFGNALEAFNVANLSQLVTKIGGIENLEKVLGFHVVPAVAFAADLQPTNSFPTLGGQNITVNRSPNGVTVIDAAGNTFKVVTADVAIDNGVVHVIDGVLLPSLDLPNVVEAATAANLTVLLDAVTAAGLGQALLDAEAITVFAPTNAAFTALLAAQEVTSLQALINKLGAPAVIKVLQFHVVPATAFSFDLAEGPQSVPTLAGENLTVTRTGANVTVRDAAGTTYNVVAADVAIENGVVHVIDGVLLPTL
ncbi:fasciclin domain-containing protein [Cognataquiflexum rubidum]|uniref:fasciclin domain-containing protein n=1 Tax=Cognataquiflexum rubidum TaxID=2922273 RepID=UPI001F132D06|nr:fasciclin domain-containing protein [Cognataquiflexum rubidum]MCH6233418.1 fasciclin domain-containing protein [Cognataquiflexum rubidum]